jgi:hypothetical protein
LLEHKPDLIFCTTQRATQSISALLAAKDLGIPQLDLYILGIMSKSHAFDRNRLLLRLGDLMKEEVLKYTSLSKKIK